MDAIQLMAKKVVGNPHSIRLIKSQARYTVSSTFRQRELSMHTAGTHLKHSKRPILFHKEDVGPARAGPKGEQQMDGLVTSKQARITECPISNKQ